MLGPQESPSPAAFTPAAPWSRSVTSDQAVQAVVTSSTVYKPREFKSLCARSAGPSCPYCAGWVAVEAQHSVLRYYSRYTTSLVTWPAHTGGWREARGNYSLQQPGPGPGGWVAAASLCSLSPCLCGVSCAVLGGCWLDVAPAVARVRLSPAAAARTTARHHASCQLQLLLLHSWAGSSLAALAWG